MHGGKRHTANKGENRKNTLARRGVDTHTVKKSRTQMDNRKQVKRTKKTNIMQTLTDIRTRWQQANKVRGLKSVHVLADGKQLNGVYMLVEAGAFTASHDALNGFCPSAGFPVDTLGQSVNDRDYCKDMDAQGVTRTIARNYDGRAIQSPVIITSDGVVLSGNGRTMAGVLAARDNTDGAYIEHLHTCCAAYGFTPEQVDSFAHPRMVFVLDEPLPYTATTFAMFNAQDMKAQSKTEQAIKYGKLIDDATFGRIIKTINAFDTLGDFYAHTEAATRCINDLRNCGVIDNMQYAGMFDGDAISAQGKETLENVLIGKAFATDPDAARKITAYKSLRKSIVTALAEIANNICLNADYTLQSDITEGINLAYVARLHGYKAGEKVSGYALQMDAFSSETVCDAGNLYALTIADTVNHEQVTLLKRIIAVYNQRAKDSADGQADIFTGGVQTKAEIFAEVKTLFAKAATKEQKDLEKSAIEARTAQNVFVSDKLPTKVEKGGYVAFMTPSGENITCKVDKVCGGMVYLIAKGDTNFSVPRNQVKPTLDHDLQFPCWLTEQAVITDGKSVVQRIESIQDGFVNFEWINGGWFTVSLAAVLTGWRPAENDICRIIE